MNTVHQIYTDREWGDRLKNQKETPTGQNKMYRKEKASLLKLSQKLIAENQMMEHNSLDMHFIEKCISFTLLNIIFSP